MCRPSWADLPRAPQKRRRDINVSRSQSKERKEKQVSIAEGVSAKTII